MWPHSSRTHLPPHPWNRREVGRAQPLKEWHGHFVVDLVACHDSCFPMECCPPSSSGHEISQARILVVVHLLGCVWLFMTPWTAACPASLSFTISRSLLKLMPIVSMMPSNHLILCHPPFLLPSIFPSIRVFSNELAPRIRWQSVGAWASASVFLMNIQGWFPLGLTGWISLQSKGLTKESSPTPQFKSINSSAGYRSGLPFPSVGDLPNTGIQSVSPAWQADSLPLSNLGSPNMAIGHDKNWIEPTRYKVAGTETSSVTWASLYYHCNTLVWHAVVHRVTKSRTWLSI